MMELPNQEELRKACTYLPLFPLPQVVLLPNTLLRLHVFEPQYVQLLEDCLEGNRLMAIPRLESGWETFDSRPSLHRTAGLGLVIHAVPLAENRYNIALLGLGRIHINDEHRSEKLYRIADAALMSNYAPSSTSWERKKDSICMLLSQLAIQNPEVSGTLKPLLEEERPPAQFLNCLAHLLLQNADKRQNYLEETDWERAADMVEDALSLALLGGSLIQE